MAVIDKIVIALLVGTYTGEGSEGVYFYDFNRQTGKVVTEHVHCAVFSPDGKYVYANDFSADRDSNSIEVYRIDPESGLLEDTGERINLSNPVCVKFL